MDLTWRTCPTDYMNGTDFRVTKTTQRSIRRLQHIQMGSKERALDENELAAIDQMVFTTYPTFTQKTW